MSRISAAVSTSRKYGIALACSPLATTRARSSSVGGWAAGVDLYLKRPRVRSRGRGMSDGAFPDRLTQLKSRWESDPTSRVFLQLAEEYRHQGRD